MKKLFNQRNTIIFVGVLTLWRLYLSAGLQLHPDEAYYWLWSRHLDIGYFDHSPLVAYFIWFTTLLSKSELGVRLSGTIVTLISSYLTWRLALQLFGSIRVAAGSVMLFNVYPLTMLGLIVITPDIPVYLFWSLSVYIFWQIIQSNKTWLWYALGVSFGLALLSKYTAILLVPCLFIYLVLTEDRRWLKTIHPYLSLLTGLLCFLPVVYWNSHHDWISFVFQFGHGLGGQSYSFDRVVEYIAGQLLVAGPIVWFLGMYAAFACFFRKDKAQLFLILMALPVIVFFGFSSLKKLAGPNWPAFAYFTFSILVTKYFLDSTSKIRRSLWYVALFASLLISAIVTLQAKFSVIPLARFSKELAVTDATNQFYGWRELGAELNKYPGMEFVVTPSHQLSAEIIYYTDEKIFVQTDEKVARISQFNLWPWPNELKGTNGFYVWEEGGAVGPYEKYFTSTAGKDSLTIFRGGIPVRRYHIIPGQNSFIPPFPGNKY
jgi:4-amino-4-deoxy-L-arabinose transferase-like glycosyltransferase